MMPTSSRVQFAVAASLFIVAGFVIGAVFGPPDPATQGIIAGIVIGVGIVVGYVLVYKTNAFNSEWSPYR